MIPTALEGRDKEMFLKPADLRLILRIILRSRDVKHLGLIDSLQQFWAIQKRCRGKTGSCSQMQY